MLIAISLFCVVCEALFTALEVALGALSRARLRVLVETENQNEDHTVDKAQSAKTLSHASRLLKLLERPERLTLGFIIVTSLSLWTASSLLTWQAVAQNWPRPALPLVLLGVLFVAEVLPLLVAARNPEAIALRCVGIVEVSLKILSPLIWLLGGLGLGVARLFGVGPNATPQVTEGELRTALREAEGEGVIESEERAMLEGAMDFRDKTVREVMTPRIDVVGVPAMMPLPAVLDLAMREGHSRLPVYESTLDRILGIVVAKDLLPHLRHPNAAMLTAREVARPAYFVPERKRIAPTLEELRRQRTLMAVVVDADGGTAGLVTLEDLLEEIVGEIQDEYDQEEPALRVVTTDNSASAIAVEAGITVREVRRFWQQNFAETLHLSDAGGRETDESMSMAALALQLFDGVPQPGDRVAAGVSRQFEIVAGRDASRENAATTRDGAAQSTLAAQTAAAETATRDGASRDGTSRDGISRDGAARENGTRANGPGEVPRIELEIMAMNGPRIEEIRLEKVLEPAA
jgi:CBS domain containing-hemolysin-like protein